jgi:hypothetical protein
MRKLQICTILLGGIFLAPFQSSLAQDVAYANQSTPGYFIFSNGPAHLSSVAGETIQMAATDADRSAGLIRVVGPIGYASVVKDELVRDGVPARASVVVP